MKILATSCVCLQCCSFLLSSGQSLVILKSIELYFSQYMTFKCVLSAPYRTLMVRYSLKLTQNTNNNTTDKCLVERWCTQLRVSCLLDRTAVNAADVCVNETISKDRKLLPHRRLSDCGWSHQKTCIRCEQITLIRIVKIILTCVTVPGA